MKRPPPGLRAHAVACLARREYSRAELRTRLLAHARKLALATEADEPQQGNPGNPGEPEWPQTARRTSERFDAEALAAQVDEVLEWLAARQLQSDARFVESRVHVRAARQGEARIRQELARHGVALDADTARQLRETELDRARLVWQGRFGDVAQDAAGRARQVRFLASRGFSGDVIRRLVGGRDDG